MNLGVEFAFRIHDTSQSQPFSVLRLQHAQARAHTQTHAHTHMHTYTHAQTHTHKYNKRVREKRERGGAEAFFFLAGEGNRERVCGSGISRQSVFSLH